MVNFTDSPLKDWMPAIIAGLVTVIMGWMTVRNKTSSEIRGRDWERERVVRIEMEKARELEMANGLNQAQELTVRFRTLMEGYESRIKDLTADLTIRKAEYEKLERLYDDRVILCNVCSTYHEHLRSLNARTPS